LTGRILFITPRFGSINRGVEVFTHEVAARLAAAGRDVCILSGPHDIELVAVTMIKVPVLRREILSKAIRPGAIARAAHRLRLGPPEIEAASLIWNARNIPARFDKIDIVIPQAGLLAAYWARSRWPNARIVCLGQAGVVPKELRLADAFVAMTPLDAEVAKCHRPGLAIADIPHGVDLQRFVPSATPPTERHLLCVAALVRDKGHHYLLDAFMHLPADVVLTCLGTGPELEPLRHHPASATGRVRFESLGREQMPAAYRAARAFTLPAMQEVFGIVFVEAMACGLPVVTHDAPRQRTVVGESGWFVDVRNPRAYATALLRALEAGPDPMRRRRVEHLDWPRIAQRYAQFLDEIVRDGQSKSLRSGSAGRLISRARVAIGRQRNNVAR